MRPAGKADTNGIIKIVEKLHLQENLIKDLQQYNKAKRDDVINYEFLCHL